MSIPPPHGEAYEVPFRLSFLPRPAGVEIHLTLNFVRLSLSCLRPVHLPACAESVVPTGRRRATGGQRSLRFAEERVALFGQVQSLAAVGFGLG